MKQFKYLILKLLASSCLIFTACQQDNYSINFKETALPKTFKPKSLILSRGLGLDVAGCYSVT